MTQTLHFLPWLRRGLAQTLTTVDRGEGSLPRAAPVEVFVELGEEDRVEASLAMRPVDHATALDLSQIVRRYPAPGSAGVEYGYFPLVELIAPDLPWVLTPAVADRATARLRPWVVLVCVEAAAAELVPATDGRPARLVVDDAGQLPDLDESYAWAHVQSAVEPSAAVASLSENPGAVVARLICPRRLDPDTTYRFAIVAAFRAEGDRIVPSWRRSDAPIELTVYDTWTATTGQAGSFEELCERLGPVADPSLVLGLREMDVTELGPLDPWPPDRKHVSVDYAGALWDAGVEPKRLGPLADDFATPVAELLDLSDYHVELALDAPDPIVTPPFYGAYAAEATSVPARGWLQELNLDPAYRAAAGLGVELVRIHQERFMASAFRQAGELRETNRQLSITRLQGEIGRIWQCRCDKLDAHQRVAVMRSQLAFVRDDDGSAPRRSLQESSFPNALTSPAYLRLTRPGAVVATAAAKRNPEGPSWHAALADTFGPPVVRQEVAFAQVAVPTGTRLPDTRAALDGLENGGDDDDVPDIEDPGDPGDPDGPLPTRTRARTHRAKRLTTQQLTAADTFDLRIAAEVMSARIRPLESARRRIESRIPGLVGALSDTQSDDLPSRVAVGPVIDEALVWSLAELSPELLLPGVERLPNNAVRVVEANPGFVAALLGGANHEMARELLWREYPADMGATTFRRFWDRPDVAKKDILPMADWPRPDSLAELGSAGGETIVVLVRGDLVRLYPTVRILLVDPATQIASLPAFGGMIAPDVRFMAFDVPDAQAVTASGSRWKIVFEEQPTEPRFGLDTLADGDELPPLQVWNDLSWSHLDHQSGSHLVVADALPSGTTLEGATWGRNSAHMARATYQAPYRISFRVTHLIGGS